MSAGSSGVVVREVAVGETHLVHAALVALRPHRDDRDALVARIDDVQRAEGYRLFGAFLGGEETAAGALGFRPQSVLGWGDTLYVDDLSVLPAVRRRGVAGALLDAVVAEGRARGCDAIHLDSGHQRHDAHKLYLAYGFNMTSHHFNLPL
jgi:GNAT superfamily N-acetyltransferase